MNTENNQTTEPGNFSRIIGYILLVPPLLSVLLFLAQLLSGDKLLMKFIYTFWTGQLDLNNGGGFTSALPLYFGLMAIAGAYLIKDSKR
jgi:hypothetical protein